MDQTSLGELMRHLEVHLLIRFNTNNKCNICLFVLLIVIWYFGGKPHMSSFGTQKKKKKEKEERKMQKNIT